MSAEMKKDMLRVKIANGLLDGAKLESDRQSDFERTVDAILESVSPTLESLQRENEKLRIQASNYAADAETVRRERNAADARESKLREALEAAKKRMRNCRGAIESDQVVDKDVHGSLQNGIRDIDAALSSTGDTHGN